jgi:NADPH-dependent curcumin reductase CurA
VRLGDVMVGGAVGEVIRSRNQGVPEGTVVEGFFGWQEYAVADGAAVRVVDPALAPISTALGVLGMPGLTAYFGLLDVGRPRPGETVLVSGAAGAVGSAVGQIAKIKGCRAVGVAGSAAKVRHVIDDLGFDAAFDYTAVSDYVAALREVCPGGVDVYFDNVGGPLTDAVFRVLNVRGRLSVCGQISQYNLERPELGPRFLWTLIEKRARVEGFLVFDYADRFKAAAAELAVWLRQGRLTYRETIMDGIENAPRAFLAMLRGQNLGKQLVKVADPESVKGGA